MSRLPPNVVRHAPSGRRRVGLAVIAALALALLSLLYQRTGPEMVQVGNVCGPTADDPCYAPVLKGGFPFAFMYDEPNVSVPNQLGWGEDHFRAVPFVIDIALYAIAVWLLLGLAANRRR